MKILIACLLVTSYLFVCAQPVKVSGKILNPDKSTTTQLTNLAQKDIVVKVSVDGRFVVTQPDLKSGCYLLPAVGYLYLEPGYDLTIMPTKDSNYVFTGKGSLENNLMGKAKKLINNYFPMGEDGFLFSAYLIEPDTFLVKLDAFKAQANLLLDQSTSDNFKAIAKGNIQFYARNLLGNYAINYGVDSLKQEKYYKFLADSGSKVGPMRMMAALQETHIKTLGPIETYNLYLKQFEGMNMNDSLLFINSEQYRKTSTANVEAAVMKLFMNDFIARVPQPIIKLKVVDKLITNPFIHDYYAFTFTDEIIKTPRYNTFRDSMYLAYMSSATNKTYREKISQFYNNAIDFGNNKMSPDFTFINADGKTVSLKELRGKYIYIDVWATWCEPCKNEIPFLSTIETAYAGKNIQFISLSVDSPTDKNKWLQYVKTKQLKGIQLLADNAFDSEFIKKFNINSIPRFILIAPDGKIVAADALRPSNPLLRNTLDGLL